MVNMDKGVYIIAEAGVNHNGDVEIAKELIVQAKKTGADAVKFQTINADLLSHPNAAQAEYQKRECGNVGQHAMLKKLELAKEQFILLKDFANQHDIEFISTPFDLDSLDLLLSMNLPFIKVSSGDLSFGLLLLKIAQSNKPVVISTGMANMDDIKNALAVLAYGYLNLTNKPSSFREIADFAKTINLQDVLYDKVVVLHCTTEYPAPMAEINLNVIDTLRGELKLRIGYSDHSVGTLAPQLAVAKGAVIIEKHFTLDNSFEGPDHKASLNPYDFTKMVQEIRLAEIVLGSSIKKVTDSEIKNKLIATRGIYANGNISAGSLISENDLVCLRPVGSHSPLNIWDLLNKPASRNYEMYEEING